MEHGRGWLEDLAVSPAFWHNKNVLITGHTGFKGSWLSLWLQTLGAKVFGYSLPPPTKPSLFEVATVANGMTSVTGDVRDLQHLKSVLEEYRPEILFHLAAQSLVLPSYSNPVETYAINVMGTVNVLEAVRHAKSVRVVVNITSDKCYENREWLWGYRESDTVGGHDPYSSSKGCAELITSAFRDSYFSVASFTHPCIALASARAGNVIGGGDWAPTRLVPDVMKAFARQHPAIIRNPEAVRPWQHVLEPLSGYLLLAERLWDHDLRYAESWNFGPNDDDARRVGWVVTELAKYWGTGAQWQRDTETHPHESHCLKLDCSKAKTRLSWRPVLSLARALEWTTEWYKVYYDNSKHIRTLTEEQIAGFEKMGSHDER